MSSEATTQADWYLGPGGWGTDPADATLRMVCQAQTRHEASSLLYRRSEHRWLEVSDSEALTAAQRGWVFWVAPTARDGRELLSVRCLRPCDEQVAKLLSGLTPLTPEEAQPQKGAPGLWFLLVPEQAANFVARARAWGAEVLPDRELADAVTTHLERAAALHSQLVALSDSDQRALEQLRSGDDSGLLALRDRAPQTHQLARELRHALTSAGELASVFAQAGRHPDEQQQYARWQRDLEHLRGELVALREARSAAERRLAQHEAGVSAAPVPTLARRMLLRQAATLMAADGLTVHWLADGTPALATAGGWLLLGDRCELQRPSDATAS